MAVEINLLPEEQRNKSTLKRFLILLIAFLIAFALSVWLYGQHLEQEAREWRQQADHLWTSYDERAQDIEKWRSSDIHQWSQYVDEVEEGLFPFSEVFSDIDAYLPDEAVVTEIHYGYPEELFLSIDFETIDAIAVYQEEWQDTSYIDEVWLERIDSEFSDDLSLYGDEDILPKYRANLTLMFSEGVTSDEEEDEND
ncbi:hypothetical protein [Texcoconibacillus texcoconensis]|uniref:Type IV pilus assembly protein PilN n=1 Tax=Texcoconibacillus texcoconensis TaxID=1095777 RepID=A0A840QSV7_9BACI|nr:hypothetical protein [Texcoconibacillus texcoconensis]MBB5174393.1 type IV pilus assembly protein PilN [Texcoconibacillus texcoconensis]